MEKRVNKKGQMKLSFGMIFSIILIIIFVAFAFYGISKLLDLQESVSAAQFVEGVQSDIDKLWKSPMGSQEEEYSISQKITKVCFVDYDSPAIGKEEGIYKILKQGRNEKENLFFYPLGKTDGRESFFIKNIDIGKSTAKENPLCFEVKKSKVKLLMQMNYGEALVCIGDNCEAK